MICIHCREKIDNKVATVFKCPNCGEVEIVRCQRCKRMGLKYKCPKCGFEGP